VKIVKFAIPKGHLSEETLKILDRAGYSISGSDRTYRPSINDPYLDLKILRPQEIPIFVGEGMQDVGISGRDWVQETRADVEVLLDLEYSKVSLVLAVPKTWSQISSLDDLLKEYIGRSETLRISTEYLAATSDLIKSNPVYQKEWGEKEPIIITPWWRTGKNDEVHIYLSFGATEAKPPEDADAIVEVVDTGTSLMQNNLKIIETVMNSSALLIANRDALRDIEKREKIMDVLTLLRGAVDGAKKLHIFANVKRENLEKLLKTLPALKNPTIAPLSDPEWVAVNTVINKSKFLEILPTLRGLAQGLVVHEPRQVLPLEEIATENGWI
jgi:ATP phosphoribosyltransferase